MYQVKVYVRNNAVLAMESPVLESRVEADKYLHATGFGEGYWAELVRVYPGYTVTLSSTV